MQYDKNLKHKKPGSIKIEEIKKVSLKEGDVVLLRYNEFLTPEQRESVREFSKTMFPINKVVCLDGGADLSVISKE